jgi:hypothetical protein
VSVNSPTWRNPAKATRAVTTRLRPFFWATENVYSWAGRFEIFPERVMTEAREIRF